MNKRIKKKLAKRVNVRKYSDYKMYKGFIHDFIIGGVFHTNIYKLPMNKKWIYIKAYKDYYHNPIREYIDSIIALSTPATFSAKHLIHDSNSAEVDQMMMHVNAIKDEFGLDNYKTK